MTASFSKDELMDERQFANMQLRNDLDVTQSFDDDMEDIQRSKDDPLTLTEMAGGNTSKATLLEQTEKIRDMEGILKQYELNLESIVQQRVE